ncbi:MFS transporter [Collibacillus ludicampi]|uniref:MFS transporter n=1 Tax=Collibacillus ludicampi TaxID=2771369 RepID=A0AAV4LJT7_9BACL|nr:MFS transporter [Collibacillus ludicampi]GIM48015.1 MFS transporter [Collibacillus ludicampi]
MQNQEVPIVVHKELVSKGQQAKTLLGSVLGYAADGLDMLLLSFVLVFVIKEFGLTPAQAGNLTLMTTIGTLIGSYLFGFLADIYGRIRIFSLTILLYSVATASMYFAASYTELEILRFLVGMGVGGEFGIGMAVVTESWPPKLRARATSLVAVGWQLGVLSASLLAAAVVPTFGWRAVFLFGLIPALLAAYVRFGLKEPEIWKSRNERKKMLRAKAQAGTISAEELAEYDKLAGFPLSKLFSNKKLTITTIGLTIMCFIQNFGYYGIFTWMPTVLSQKYGYTLAKASGWLFISTVGMLVGILLFGILADKIGRKKTFALYYIGGTIYCVIYFFVFKDQTVLLWGSALLGFFVNGMMGGFGAILAENYVSEARSTAENFIFGTGRGLAGFGPALIGALAVGGNILGAMSLIFLIYPIGLLVMLTLVPETKGVKLE